jgi:genome maintenance exonuclease 1
MMADQIIENGLRNKLDEIWGCEATLYYPGKYAGAADCVGFMKIKRQSLILNKVISQKKMNGLMIIICNVALML